MSDIHPSDIETICKQLFDEFRGVLSWKWDDWVGTILSEISTDQEENIRLLLEKSLPVSWDSSNINTAPPMVQTLDKHLGGLRPTQRLFTSDPSNDAFVFCAWWPWGSGIAISLRIAPFDHKFSNSEKNKLMEQMKVWAEI